MYMETGYPSRETLIRRVLDSYDSVSELMDEIGFDLWEFIDWLIEEEWINPDTMPYVFNFDNCIDEESVDE